MDNILTVKDLSVSFDIYGGKVKAVQNLSLNIHKGEIFALVGESGCGKSTIANTILKLNEDNTTITAKTLKLKEINILNATSKEMGALRGNIVSMIFQDPISCLNPTMKIGKQIIETLIRKTKIDINEGKKEALRLLDLVQIPDAKLRYEQYPHQLSGGMKQRVMIAMALACNPDLLIADEPTTALDVTTQFQILELIASIQKKANMAVLLITHDFGVVANIADRVGVMYAGNIVEEGMSEEIFANPRHPYTQGLLRCLPSTNIDGKLFNIPGEPPDMYKPPQGCPFASRCNSCMKICLRKMPPVFDLLEDHNVACWKFYRASYDAKNKYNDMI